jgi:hypothetical protein
MRRALPGDIATPVTLMAEFYAPSLITVYISSLRKRHLLPFFPMSVLATFGSSTTKARSSDTSFLPSDSVWSMVD